MIMKGAIGIALLTMLWGGIFVAGVTGISFCNPDINIKARISARGMVTGLTLFAGAVVYMTQEQKLPLLSTFSPFASVAIIPYAIVLLLLLCSFFKPILGWCFVDANLLATICIFDGMGIVFWFSEGGEDFALQFTPVLHVVARTLFV